MANKIYLKFTTLGDWAGALRDVKNLEPDIRSSVIWGQRKMTTKLVKIVKGHITNQDLRDWQPLAESTKKRKGHGKVFIDDEIYLQSIKTWRKDFIYYAGVPRGVTSKNDTETARVAAIHEFKSYSGTGPYRPLWGPSIDELGGREGIKREILRIIAAKLLTRGWSITKI